MNNDTVKAGFTIIDQLLDSNGQFLSYHEIQNASRGTVDMLRYFSIIENFDVLWKRILRTDTVWGNRPNFLERLLATEHISSVVCNNLVHFEYAVEPRMRKWEKYLRCEIGIQEFHKAVQRIYVTTNYAKFRSFQFRLLHNTIVRNK